MVVECGWWWVGCLLVGVGEGWLLAGGDALDAAGCPAEGLFEVVDGFGGGLGSVAGFDLAEC